MAPMDNTTYRNLDNEYCATFDKLQEIYYLQVLPFGRADDEDEYNHLQIRLSELSHALEEYRDWLYRTEQLLNKK